MMKTKNGPKVVYGTASVLTFTAVLCCAKVFLVEFFCLNLGKVEKKIFLILY